MLVNIIKKLFVWGTTPRSFRCSKEHVPFGVGDHFPVLKVSCFAQSYPRTWSTAKAIAITIAIAIASATAIATTIAIYIYTHIYIYTYVNVYIYI